MSDCDYCGNFANKKLGESRALFRNDTKIGLSAYKSNCTVVMTTDTKISYDRYILDAEIIDESLLMTCFADNKNDLDDLIGEQTKHVSIDIPINYCPMCGRKLKEAADV